ncbi:FAD-dependent oxidoreductase [Thermoleptolyngbya oregonensis NK1-22]|uniref:FAD-dependent oxidoreductase n=1 Tax=Thermoleptolyngbya oregonensis NK1-22 TaxID=2547457 RepID=A0AA97BQ64_9CYAN|nr:FAD-dependent oxidoreductase [Thermoleptolyngbya oregonensis NK1-22]
MKRFFFSRRLAWIIPVASLLAGASSAVLVSTIEQYTQAETTDGKLSAAEPSFAQDSAPDAETVNPNDAAENAQTLNSSEQSDPTKSGSDNSFLLPNGRPSLSPLPAPAETWECEVAVVGGSLGGVAAASHAMRTGAKTCLIELTPWMGGQISSQGVSAVDESRNMLERNNFSPSWQSFKDFILQQPVTLPAWTGITAPLTVAQINSCWVGRLCFPPQVGAVVSQEWLKRAAQYSTSSKWSAFTAFKGAEFDETGRFITAIYAVRRSPRESGYVPQGRPSVELATWYAWEDDATFRKTPIKLQPPPGKRMIVIDATDTGEVVGWAKVPLRIGSDSRNTTGETNAADFDNPECTQAFTFPFAMGIRADGGQSIKTLEYVQSFYPRAEHMRVYTLEGVPMFHGRSFFNYRRIVSLNRSDPFFGSPVLNDITLVNWTQGNDWNWMNPPLILTPEKLMQTGQYQNWMGGVSLRSMRHAENHALMFAHWLLEQPPDPALPLAYLAGADSPMGTVSGLSMLPYIREGRRILGRSAYGQTEFMLREADLREDMEGRDFRATAVGVTHYDIDIHGCRYRNWEPTGEAVKASVKEYYIRPVQIPLESLIPQGVENLLVGGKAIAATHIATAMTRIHHGEWTIGSAAGVTAGWLVDQPDLQPAQIVPQGKMPQLQQYMIEQGLRLDW